MIGDRRSVSAGIHIAAAMVLVLVGLSVYSSGIDNGFVMDDRIVVENNLFLSSPGNIKDLISPDRYFAGSGEGTYRPLTTLSYFADNFLWGYDPRGYHLTGILIHILNGILLYSIMNIFIGRVPDARDMSGGYVRTYLALLISVLFLVHPIQTEAVNFVGGRHDLIMTFFYFMAIIMYLIARSGKGIRSLMFYLISLTAYMFSCLSKEMGITLPVMLMVLDVFGRDKGRRSFLNDLMRYYTGYILVACVFLYIRFFVMIYPGEAGATAAGIADMGRIFAVPWILAQYLRMLFFPLFLTVEHVAGPGYPVSIPGSASDPRFWGGAVFLCCFIWSVIRLWRKYPMLSFGWAWVAVSILPVSNIFFLLIRFPVKEKYLYLPVAGYCVFLVFAVFYLLRSGMVLASNKVFRLAVKLSMAVLLLFFCVTSFARNLEWEDGVTLWSSALRVSPGSYRAYFNLGMSYKHDRGMTDEALSCFRKSLEYNDTAMAHEAIGSILQERGEHDKAVTEFEKALSMEPSRGTVYSRLGAEYVYKGMYDRAIDLQKKALDMARHDFRTFYTPVPYAEIYEVLGKAYYGKGFMTDAIVNLERSIEADNRRMGVYETLARAYVASGREDEAAELYRQGLTVFPGSIHLRRGLGRIYLHQGKYDDALREYDAVLKADPSDPGARNDRARIYVIRGENEKAVKEYLAVIEAAPSYYPARNNLANIYLAEGRYDEAIDEYGKVIQLYPDNAVVYFNLGLAYEGKGDASMAVAQWQKALELDPSLDRARRAIKGARRDTSVSGRVE